MQPAKLDPTPLFDLFRGNYATELLTSAVAHFDVFGTLADGPIGFEAFCEELGLASRPANVLVTALRAMGLIAVNKAGQLKATELGSTFLVPAVGHDIGGYLGLAAKSPGVVEMVERLRTNRPANAEEGEPGAAFIFREGLASAMELEVEARTLTLALAGRARNVAPVLADVYPLDGVSTLLDVAGGSGLYGIAWLLRHPDLRVILWDRPEVLKVAAELAAEHGVADRLDLVAGDMFSDPVPAGADAILLSNVLHDWDVPECRMLVNKCAEALGPGGRLLIHDVFLDDDQGGPLPIALYSAALFTTTEGRAYSRAEYAGWLTDAGLEPAQSVATRVHCGVLPATKSGAA
ncbi:methyltransferase [Isosphaeraceae bacterium EP7]